jgi:hypothetical protein
MKYSDCRRRFLLESPSDHCQDRELPIRESTLDLPLLKATHEQRREASSLSLIFVCSSGGTRWRAGDITSDMTVGAWNTRVRGRVGA